jgi:hypothetical protein
MTNEHACIIFTYFRKSKRLSKPPTTMATQVDDVCKMAYEGNFPQFKLRIDKDPSLVKKKDSVSYFPLVDHFIHS